MPPVALLAPSPTNSSYQPKFGSLVKVKEPSPPRAVFGQWASQIWKRKPVGLVILIKIVLPVARRFQAMSVEPDHVICYNSSDTLTPNSEK